MKLVRHFRNLLLAIVLSTFTYSCSSDSSSDGVGSGGLAENGTIKATVSGTNFLSMSMTTTGFLSPTNNGLALFVEGTEMDMESENIRTISLAFNNISLEPMSYDLGGELLGETAVMYREMTTANDVPVVSVWHAPSESETIVGKIIVTEISQTNVKGTFFFTAQMQDENGVWLADFKEITNGSFNVNLVQY